MLPVDVLGYRDRIKCSQKELAEKLGVDRTTVVRWENGHTAIPDDLEPKLRALAANVPQEPPKDPKAPPAAPVKISIRNAHLRPDLLLYEGHPNQKGQHHPERLQHEGFLQDPVPDLPPMYLKDFGGQLLLVREERKHGYLPWEILSHPVYVQAVGRSRAWYAAHGERKWKDSTAAHLRAYAARQKQAATPVAQTLNETLHDLPSGPVPASPPANQAPLASLPSRQLAQK